MDEKGLDPIRKKVKKTNWIYIYHFVFLTFLKVRLRIDWIYLTIEKVN